MKIILTNNMKKVIILMGVPGSGKGTQAELLAKKFGYGHISTGNLLRKLATDPEADREDKEKLEEMKAGRLVDNELIYKLAFAEMEKFFLLNKGVILDGAIRTIEQAERFQRFFEEKGMNDDMVVIDVNISDDVSLERLMHRKETSTAMRADDNLEIMRKRIQEQGNEAIKPILYFYESLKLLRRAHGERSIEDVQESIVKILEEF